MEKLLGFSKWHKVGDKLKSHANNGTHSTAITPASGFKERFEKPSLTLTYGYDNQRTEKVQHNGEILKWIIKAIELCENNTSFLEDIVKTLLPMRTIAIF